jgi:TolB-like protein/DNA-binding winged helix-turn-helix (wHTH) protein/Tfp pilus assembly protein PilF
MAPGAGVRERFRVGDLLVDVGRQTVTGPSGEVTLPKLSFDLLIALVRRAPDFVSNDELSSLVWSGVVVSPETVTKRVNLLRAALGDDSASPRYVAGLRARGYRIAAAVSRESTEPAATNVMALPAVPPAHSSAVPAPAPPPQEPSSRLSPHARRAALLVLLGAAVAAAWWTTRNEHPAPPAHQTDSGTITAGSVAVLPFENLSPSPDDGYLAVGVPEMVLTQLSSVPGLTVIAYESASRTRDQALDARETGRRIGARYIVLGSVQRSGSELRIVARMVDTVSGTQVWSTRVDRDISALFAVEGEIAAQIVDELRRRINGVAPRPVTARHEPPVEAQIAYLQGRALLNRYTVRGAESAAAKFADAVALDPRFADAEAGLFDARMLAAERRHENLAAVRTREMTLVTHALELDPECGSAYIARAIWGAGEPVRREADFRRGLQLDPSNGRGLVAYSEFLDRQGRYDEGGRMLDRALLIDPLSPRVQFRKVMRQFDLTGSKSLEPGMRQVLEADPDYQPALQRYAKYRWTQGALADASQIIEHAVEVDPDNPWSRQTAAAIYLDLGDEQSARKVAAGTPSSLATAKVLLGLYAGDWRGAGEAAYSPAGREYNLYESWGVPEAIRDHALHTGQYKRAISYLEERYGLDGNPPVLDVSNFRAAACVAQLLQASGDKPRSKRLLARLPAAIDASIPRYGKLFALRTKATVQLLAGDPDAALRTLADSFAADDLTQWWYTLEHDPLWQPLRDDPVFVATAAQVRAKVALEQAKLTEARRAGRVPTGAKPTIGTRP